MNRDILCMPPFTIFSSLADSGLPYFIVNPLKIRRHHDKILLVGMKSPVDLYGVCSQCREEKYQLSVGSGQGKGVLFYDLKRPGV